MFDKDWNVDPELGRGMNKLIAFLDKNNELIDTFEWENNRWDHHVWYKNPVVVALQSDWSKEEFLSVRLTENIKTVGYGFTPPHQKTSFTLVGTLVRNS